VDSLPSGVVTFCFTDIEGSTPLLARLGSEAYQSVIEEHRRIIRAATGRHGGVEVSTEGDGKSRHYGGAGRSHRTMPDPQLTSSDRYCRMPDAPILGRGEKDGGETTATKYAQVVAA
jgi:hypothetical protein